MNLQIASVTDTVTAAATRQTLATVATSVTRGKTVKLVAHFTTGMPSTEEIAHVSGQRVGFILTDSSHWFVKLFYNCRLCYDTS